MSGADVILVIGVCLAVIFARWIDPTTKPIGFFLIAVAALLAALIIGPHVYGDEPMPATSLGGDHLTDASRGDR